MVIGLLISFTIVILLMLSYLICGYARTTNHPIVGGVTRSPITRTKQPEYTNIGEPIHFEDHPTFVPNLTPRQMFKLGSFGGTYWRPIHSSVTNKNYHDQHLEFATYKTFEPMSGYLREVTWWEDIPNDLLTQSQCDETKNRYKVSSGTSLEYWESRNWMHPQDPYGWVQWYCRFYAGRRTQDDERQIARWKAFAGLRGRFRLRLINMCKRANTTYDDELISPVIRQGLQHWAYVLTKEDV